MFNGNPSTRWYAEEAEELPVLVGVENRDQLVEWFGGMSVREIGNELDRCFSEPRSELEELAQRIYNEVGR